MSFQIDKQSRVRGMLQAAVATACVLACLGSPLKAQDEDEGGHRCNVASLAGAYGLQGSGVRGVGPGVVETFVITGLRRYDGKGGFTTVSSTHGTVTGVAKDLKVSGTYQVNPDCTGTVTIIIPGLPEPLVSSFVIVNRGQDVLEATMSPATSVGTATLHQR